MRPHIRLVSEQTQSDVMMKQAIEERRQAAMDEVKRLKEFEAGQRKVAIITKLILVSPIILFGGLAGLILLVV